MPSDPLMSRCHATLPGLGGLETHMSLTETQLKPQRVQAATKWRTVQPLAARCCHAELCGAWRTRLVFTCDIFWIDCGALIKCQTPSCSSITFRSGRETEKYSNLERSIKSHPMKFTHTSHGKHVHKAIKVEMDFDPQLRIWISSTLFTSVQGLNFIKIWLMYFRTMTAPPLIGKTSYEICLERMS